VLHPSLAEALTRSSSSLPGLRIRTITLGIHSDTRCARSCVTVRSQIAMAHRHPMLNVGTKPEVELFRRAARLWHVGCFIRVIAGSDPQGNQPPD
jgi:hypothetical protein